jgi:predicted aldo/keto reductase-like oxidoreductase
VIIASLVFALVAGYVIVGHYLYRLPIGFDASGFLFGDALQSFVLLFAPDLQNGASGGVWLLLWALAIPAAVFWAVRRSVRGSFDPARRGFLTGSGAGAGVAFGAFAVSSLAAAARGIFGVGTGTNGWAGMSEIQAKVPYTDPNPKKEWEGARIAGHRRFGRTEWQISDIVLGTGRITSENGERIARMAIDRGVNYFDTSPDYAGAGSEQVMGRAIKGVRDKLFIATKFCTPVGHLPTGTPVTKYMQVIEGSLGRLATDYVDLIHVHACDDVARLMDPNMHEAFDRLKQQGKARFLGFSSHTPNLMEVANTSIDSGYFDVMMLAYHHGLWGGQPEVISRAVREQDMGIVAMKTLKGAKHQKLLEFRDEADSYSQAALKWVLSNPDVSAAVISFFELQHVDEFLYASGKELTRADVAILEKYDGLIAGTHCAPHCGVCLGSCPEQLPIDDVLRHRMYFEDYGQEKEAMRLYAQLETNASVCVGCSAPCAGSCPIGIDIPERVAGAHELLTVPAV